MQSFIWAEMGHPSLNSSRNVRNICANLCPKKVIKLLLGHRIHLKYDKEELCINCQTKFWMIRKFAS